MDFMMLALSNLILGSKGHAGFCTKLMSKGAMEGCGLSGGWPGLAGKEKSAQGDVVGRTPPCELSSVASSEGQPAQHQPHTLPRGTDASRSQISFPQEMLRMHRFSYEMSPF